jgi:hypothetical protein
MESQNPRIGHLRNATKALSQVWLGWKFRAYLSLALRTRPETLEGRPFKLLQPFPFTVHCIDQSDKLHQVSAPIRQELRLLQIQQKSDNEVNMVRPGSRAHLYSDHYFTISINSHPFLWLSFFFTTTTIRR